MYTTTEITQILLGAVKNPFIIRIIKFYIMALIFAGLVVYILLVFPGFLGSIYAEAPWVVWLFLFCLLYIAIITITILWVWVRKRKK